MAKHKTKQYRRNQRNCHIEKKKNIIRNKWYDDFWEVDTFRWHEEHVMPVTGKLSKGNVRDCMKERGSFNEYTMQEQKRAASMLAALKEQEELAGIDGPLKSSLTRIVKNNWRHKDKSQSDCRKETFSYEDFQFLLSERDSSNFRLIQFKASFGCRRDRCLPLPA